MIEELLECLRANIPDLSDMDEDRCLLLVEKNFSGKLNASDFWYRISGEKSFLSPNKQRSMATKSTWKLGSMSKASLYAEEEEGGGGLCGCFKKKNK